MKMQDCKICLSAGSVNQWGVCEICGEEADEVISFSQWNNLSSFAVIKHTTNTGVAAGVAPVVTEDGNDRIRSMGQDAA